jgi:hypothetical protein
MFYKKNNSLSKMNEDNDYGQFTLIDIEDNTANPRYDITIKVNKTYHIKYKNDIESNIHSKKNHDDDDDDPKKPNNKNYYLENTIYSTTIILAIVIFIYLC